MKFKTVLLYGTLCLATGFGACDKITHPLIQQGALALPKVKPSDTNSSKNPNVYKLLLEDCTGHFCVNCPNAAAIGDSLINPATNPASAANIIMMQDNIGPLAYPRGQAGASDPPPGVPIYAFTANYLTYAGTTWGQTFSIGNTLPVGMINRDNYTTKSPASVQQQYTNWDDTIITILTPTVPTAKVTIDIHDSSWHNSVRFLAAEFQVTFKTALPGNYSLITVIVQDSIKDWQVQHAAPGYDSAFIHRNVLRGAFGGNSGGNPSGVAIPATYSGTAGSTWTVYQNYDFVNGENGVAAGWIMANCYIIAFVTNTATYQVVQAEMLKVEGTPVQ